jgi:hypothetical protein
MFYILEPELILGNHRSCLLLASRAIRSPLVAVAATWSSQTTHRISWRSFHELYGRGYFAGLAGLRSTNKSSAGL